MTHKFQVNLGGIIELLSNHLYGTPEVYVRELLQNGVDAITARRAAGGDAGHIRISLLDAPTRLVFEDDGIGLTEDEVHRFLATIGESSKRGAVNQKDLLGQFGIGLLSCFVVSDEIMVMTRADSSDAVEWRGKVDGTYSVSARAGAESPIGTRVELVAKRGAEALFSAAKVNELVTRYGGLLPYPIEVVHRGGSTIANAEPPVFRRAVIERSTALAYGKQMFGEDFLDAIVLRSEPGDVAGLAFVRPTAASPGAKRSDRVYLKGMLLGDSAADLLPAWAGFVRCVVDARDLRPTASREAFYQDEMLDTAREQLARALRDHFGKLAITDEHALNNIIHVHGTWLKAMCLEDDALFRAIVDWFPFETTLGLLTLGELRRREPIVRYSPTVDGYRQVAQVAAAEGLAIVNAGYIHDAELLAKLPTLIDARVEAVSVDDIVHAFEDVALAELDAAHEMLRTADVALRPFRCIAELKCFSPETLPVMYAASQRAAFRREGKRTAEAAGGLWGSVLDRVVEANDGGDDDARIVFNHRNPLVRRLIEHAHDRGLLHHTIRALYTHALMLGHHPLGVAELTAMNESLVGLVELATLPLAVGKAKA
ncbi:MAG: molecular chaperone HtpG [Myxococcales bacterium]|nr:molecular chaperone HtpG [Myxococcales bacterium]